MIVASLDELEIMGVFDRGVPDHERISIYVHQYVNMGQFGLLLGVRQQEKTAFPIQDNFFWFGDGRVNKGDWIFLYTGLGGIRTSEIPNTKSKMYVLHWGRNVTILNQEDIVPILFRIDAVDVHARALELPNTSQQEE